MFTNVLPPYQNQWNSLSSMFQLFFLLHIPSPRHACKSCPQYTQANVASELLCHLLFKYVRLYAAYTLFFIVVVAPCKIKATHHKCFFSLSFQLNPAQ